MIKQQNIKPLDILEARQLQFSPPHFEYVDIPLKYNLEDSLIKWIKKNLKKRFYVGKNIKLSENNRKILLTVSFEDSKELSYFMLACPHLKYN